MDYNNERGRGRRGVGERRLHDTLIQCNLIPGVNAPLVLFELKRISLGVSEP